MLRLSDQEISELYAMICHYHNTYLAKEGVRLPKLRRGQEYTKDALTLVYLAYHYPEYPDCHQRGADCLYPAV